MDPKIIQVFYLAQEKLKGSFSLLGIINKNLESLVNKYKCCLDLSEKAIGYKDLYNDINNKYNRLLLSAKKLNTIPLSISTEITHVHKFSVILFDDLLAFDKKISKRSIELIQLSDIEERNKHVAVYNLPSVPKHKPTMKGGKKNKKRKTKRRKTKRRKTKRRKTKRRKTKRRKTKRG
jgi:hypothetical protein